MSSNDQNDFRKYRVLLGIAGFLIAIGVVAAAIKMFSHGAAPSRREQLRVVALLPPPPPTPPPTPPPQVKATPPPEMVKQEKIVAPEPKPKTPEEKPRVAKPNSAPPGPLGVKGKGTGTADSFGLVGGGGGGGAGGGGGSRWGWYASQVQTRVEQALRNNSHTRASSMQVQVKIWANNIGRIVRVQLLGTTGNSVVDNAITNEVLNGLQLQEPPPQDMPMPIVMRLSARRPN